ncbi:hypothetical protein [Derxia gummosa]|uniref:Lipoprotein n=1 Tax=Derxia gummosa DSM 723 TaxID=1121388 RepID=A0A8B6X648_9BURK|nr:hypothetical protein [Derxia gummosa]
MRATRLLLIATCLPLALAACGKATEVAGDKLTEKMVERQMEQNGVTNAKVDMADGGVRASFTDEKGQQGLVDMGKADVKEADLGLPFYPGATPGGEGSTRIINEGTEMVTVSLTSADAPTKVAEFYRERLRALAKGRQLLDMAEPSGAATLMLSDGDKAGVQVHVKAGADNAGSEITLVAHHPVKTPG